MCATVSLVVKINLCMMLVDSKKIGILAHFIILDSPLLKVKILLEYLK